MRLQLTLGRPGFRRCERCGHDDVLTVPILSLTDGAGPSCSRTRLISVHQDCPGCDQLLTRAQALFGGRFLLNGCFGTGISLHCRDAACASGGRTLGYLTGLQSCPDADVPAVDDLTGLAGVAVTHLATAHPDGGEAA